MPAKPYRVIARVVSQQGTCSAGHKVGDEWAIGQHTPAGICLSAFTSILPNVRAMRFGAQFPWAENDMLTCACPDAKNPVVIQLRREPVE